MEGEYENYEQISDEEVDETLQDSDFRDFNFSLFYKSNDHTYIREVMKGIGYGIFAARFNAQLVDRKSLLMLTATDIRSILHDVPCGIIVQFEKAFTDWKELNSNDSSIQVNSQTIQSNSSNVIQKGIVKKILKSSDEGQTFLRGVDMKLPLPDKERSKLMKLLCQYFMKKGMELTKKDINMIADDIVVEYPEENKRLFFDNSSKGGGALYDKYHNMRRSLKGNVRKRKANTEDEMMSEESFSDNAVLSNNIVTTTTANIDLEFLMEHWRLSHPIRMKLFKSKPQEKFTDLYRALLRTDSLMLINIDFELLYPEHNDFKDSWEQHEPKILQALSKAVKDSQMNQLLSKLNTMTSNQKTATIISALHYALYSGKKFHKSEETTGKSTIAESIEFMLLLVSQESEKDDEVQKFAETVDERKLLLQALIVGYGGSEQTIGDKFSIKVEDMEYMVEGPNALLQALSLLIKIYYVFSIDFPVLNQTVYQFLAENIMGLATDNSKRPTNKLTRFCDMLK